MEGAVALAQDEPQSMFLVTGGIGRYGPAEAVVMRDMLLEGGVAPERILIEDKARDTLESVLLCDRLLSGRGDVARIVPCTSRYHIPRCALLLRMLGYPVQAGRMPSDRPQVAHRQLALYVLKECIATPYDAFLLGWKLSIRRARR